MAWRRADAVLDEIVKYLGSDLLFYRSDAPERLVGTRHGPGIRSWPLSGRGWRALRPDRGVTRRATARHAFADAPAPGRGGRRGAGRAVPSCRPQCHDDADRLGPAGFGGPAGPNERRRLRGPRLTSTRRSRRANGARTPMPWSAATPAGSRCRPPPPWACWRADPGPGRSAPFAPSRPAVTLLSVMAGLVPATHAGPCREGCGMVAAFPAAGPAAARRGCPGQARA